MLLSFSWVFIYPLTVLGLVLARKEQRCEADSPRWKARWDVPMDPDDVIFYGLVRGAEFPPLQSLLRWQLPLLQLLCEGWSTLCPFGRSAARSAHSIRGPAGHITEVLRENCRQTSSTKHCFLWCGVQFLEITFAPTVPPATGPEPGPLPFWEVPMAPPSACNPSCCLSALSLSPAQQATFRHWRLPKHHPFYSTVTVSAVSRKTPLLKFLCRETYERSNNLWLFPTAGGFLNPC